jgi:thiamine-phosphate pyrophosphorylase
MMTDIARGYDLARQTEIAPKGAWLIERTFGQKATPNHGRALRLATVTPRQARQAKLAGVHWPEKRLHSRKRSQNGALIETASAHRGLTLGLASQRGLSIFLVSAAFNSDSPSAKAPKGPVRLALLQRAFPACLIFALGGVHPQTIKRLIDTGIYGVGLVSLTKPSAKPARLEFKR